MHARLVEVEGIDTSRRDEIKGVIRERVLAGMKEIGGFAGLIWLIDEKSGRARTLLLWETQEGADEAERQFAARREEIVSGFGGTVRSADLFEAPIVEVQAGVRT
jgi:hypothetical protein